MTTKRIVCIVLVLITVAALASCGEKKLSDDELYENAVRDAVFSGAEATVEYTYSVDEFVEFTRRAE